MPFSFDSPNPSHRFYYDDSKEEWIDLRVVPEAKYHEFRKELGIKQKRTREFDKSGKPVYVDQIDYDEDKIIKLADKVNDYQIEKWHLVTDVGEEIPCTTENKKFLISESPDFASFFAKCKEKLEDEKEVISEEGSGN